MTKNHLPAAIDNKDTIKPLQLNGEYIRDEIEQATYTRKLLEIFTEEGVDSALVFNCPVPRTPT